MPPSLFPMPLFLHVLHLYVFSSSLQLTWLADPALVTSVYPNWMQYMPRVLQEVSLLDGVDASVHGNGRRFSKTSVIVTIAYATIARLFFFISLSPTLHLHSLILSYLFT